MSNLLDNIISSNIFFICKRVHPYSLTIRMIMLYLLIFKNGWIKKKFGMEIIKYIIKNNLCNVRSDVKRICGINKMYSLELYISKISALICFYKLFKIIGYRYSYNIFGGGGSTLPPNTSELQVIRYLHAIDSPQLPNYAKLLIDL